jgi:hypothetical protein
MFKPKAPYKALVFSSLLALVSLTCAAQTTVLFNLQSTLGGPFPTNSLTVADPTQQTGLRIQMPASEDTCDLSSSAVICGNQQLLNTLDGFSENPRLMVCFSGPVNPGTLQPGIFVVPTQTNAAGWGHNPPPSAGNPITINQVLYDPTSNCAYAKPDQVLAQDTTYLLAATSEITDTNGNPVIPAPQFTECLAGGSVYCSSLASAVSAANLPAQITGAAVFTTMTATSWARAVHAIVNIAPTFVIRAGPVSTFNLSNIASLTWNTAQSAPPTSQPIPLNVLDGVGKIAFGLFTSLNFLNPATGTITFGPSDEPIGSLPVPIFVSFHVLLPATPPPPGGYPVVLWGHGLGDNQFGASTYIASTLAKNGFAILTIEVTGQGFGAGSTVTVNTNSGKSFTEATPGRGVLLPGNSTIGPSDGCIIVGSPIGTRDCNLQTVVDLSAIVHAIRTSAVQSALGLQLDPNHIYYAGQSEGSIFGTLFNAVEPNIRAVVLSVGGGTSVDIARTSLSGRPLALAYAQVYGLFNVPALGAPPQPYFNDPMNDNYVFRDQPALVNEVPGAVAVQAGFESADWLQMLGDPLSFASHLQSQPLTGVTPKPVLFLFSKGDLEVPNPTNSALIRAAGIQNTSWFLEFDQAVAAAQAAGYYDLFDPHPLLSYPTIFSYPDQQSIALAEQQQVAAFLASDGKNNPNPNPLLTAPFQGLQLFVIPQTLPEQLNYFQIPTSNVD